MRIIAVFALFLPLTLPVSMHAQSFGGVGTRAEGMGGAFVAVADDASAVYWNPAGIATGATFDLQVSKGPDSGIFVGVALPVLGASYYRTREVTGLPTVSASPDRQNGGSGEVQLQYARNREFRSDCRANRCPRTGYRNNGEDCSRRTSTPSKQRTTFDLDAGAMVSAWDLRFGLTARNLMEPEFESDAGIVRMTRQFRVGAALAPRALPTGVHGPFTLAIDADLTTTPDVRGDRRTAAAGGEYWLAKGFVGIRAGVRWSTLGSSSRALSGGITVRLPRSIHAEGQMTKDNESNQSEWTVGARVTF